MSTVYVTFPGINKVLACEYTRTLGIEPDVAVLTCIPQPNPPNMSGDLVFADDPNEVLSLPDFGIDYTKVYYSTQGQIGTVVLEDTRRRWKWRTISGRYNVVTADGSIDPATEQTPQELATLLLTALGVVTFDVTAIPDDDRPSVDWQYDRADLELDALLETRGCEVSLNNDNSVTIVNIGVGAAITEDDDVLGAGFSIDPPEVPEDIKLVCGKSLWQSRLKLVPVAEETDGSFVALADVSYVPAGGWADVTDDEFFLGIADPVARALALRSVYKCYQVESQADGTQNILDYVGTIDDISQLLPLNNFKLESYTVDGTTVLRRVPAIVRGTYEAIGDPPPGVNTDPMTVYGGQFSIDRERGIVRFRDRVTKFNSGLTQRVAADLYLETSYCIINFDTQQYEREIYTFPLGGDLDGSHVIRDNDFVATTIVNYDDEVDPLVQDSVTTNQTDLETASLARLTAEAARFQFDVGNSLVYRTIKDISTDGAIRQVTWDINIRTQSGRPCTTTVARNAEIALGVPRLSVKRRRRQAERDINNKAKDKQLYITAEAQGRDR